MSVELNIKEFEKAIMDYVQVSSKAAHDAIKMKFGVMLSRAKTKMPKTSQNRASVKAYLEGPGRAIVAKEYWRLLSLVSYDGPSGAYSFAQRAALSIILRKRGRKVWAKSMRKFLSHFMRTRNIFIIPLRIALGKIHDQKTGVAPKKPSKIKVIGLLCNLVEHKRKQSYTLQVTIGIWHDRVQISDKAAKEEIMRKGVQEAMDEITAETLQRIANKTKMKALTTDEINNMDAQRDKVIIVK